MASTPAKEIVKYVKPILSTNSLEARRRVLRLYKLWAREIPYTIFDYDLAVSPAKGLKKLKSEFLKHKNVTDLRIIDMLIIRGEMEYKDTITRIKQKNHVMNYFKDTVIPPPKNFLEKFLSGSD